jgi:F0F1-type ATP synthase assembly protein I
VTHSGGQRRQPLTGGAGPYIWLGWQIALSFVVYAAIGYFLDRWLDTTPWLLIAGVVMGLVAVFARIYRVSLEIKKQTQKAGSNEESGKRAGVDGR